MCTVSESACRAWGVCWVRPCCAYPSAGWGTVQSLWARLLWRLASPRPGCAPAETHEHRVRRVRASPFASTQFVWWRTLTVCLHGEPLCVGGGLNTRGGPSRGGGSNRCPTSGSSCFTKMAERSWLKFHSNSKGMTNERDTFTNTCLLYNKAWCLT